MSNGPRVGLVLGAGWILGGAWLVGALDAIARETGWDPGSADRIVGTSAGSMIGGLLASGVPPWFMVAHSAGDDLEGLLDAGGADPTAADRSAGGVFRLPRVLPHNVALELALTGDPIDAERAYQLGLVNVLAEPGTAIEAALELAERISACAPVAVQKTRALIHELADADDETGLRRSNEVMFELMNTEDFSEGLTAFIEKRPPAWKGK